MSYLIYQNWNAEVKGLDAFPKKNWPDNIPLLYYSYHIMVGLGTIFIAIMVLAAFLLWRGRLYGSRWMLWVLMLAIPFPFIANTAGWFTAELGRQPWLAYGLFRTSEGVSPPGLLGQRPLHAHRVRGDVPDHGPPLHRADGARGRTTAPRRWSPPRPHVLEKEAVVETIWFICVAFMIAMYVLLDGFDIGAGGIHLFAARDDRERRTIIRAIGPVWDGNEVWLIAAGGTLFFAFPVLYASSFSGFYLPLIIVLWLLMLRGLSIELRGHIENPLWASSGTRCSLSGAPAGRLLRRRSGQRRARRPAQRERLLLPAALDRLQPLLPNPGILDWYTVLIGLLALTTVIVHGANFIALKTEDDLNARSRGISRLFALVTAALTALATLATFWVSPWLLESFNDGPTGTSSRSSP